MSINSKILFFIILQFSFKLFAEEMHFKAERLRLIKFNKSHEVTISDEFSNYLVNEINISEYGCAISNEMKRLSTIGFKKLNNKKLKMKWVIDRPSAPLAQYTNDGEIEFNASLVLGSPDNAVIDRPNVFKSFVVHEMVHALVDDLNSRGLFSPYDPSTKLNELLAYRIQGKFIDEIKKNGSEFDERDGIPIWDMHSIAMVEALKSIGISEVTNIKKGKDILADLLLSAKDDGQIQKASSLANYYDFINQSDDPKLLWNLNIKNAQTVQSTIFLNALISAGEVNYNYDNFFAYLKNRIPLYSSYPNYPSELGQNKEQIQVYIQNLDEYLRKACSSKLDSDDISSCHIEVQKTVNDKINNIDKILIKIKKD